MSNIFRFIPVCVWLSTFPYAAQACCPCKNVDPSPCQDSFELSDDALFGCDSHFPAVAPLSLRHEDKMTLRIRGAFLNEMRDVTIPNGSLLGFTDPGFIGQAIQACSTDAHSGFSHVGLAITGLPSEMMNITLASIKEGGLSLRKKKYHTAQLDVLTTTYPYLKVYLHAARKGKLTSPTIQNVLRAEKNDIFCFESTGSPEEVLRGIAPRVRLTPLSSIVANYHGDLCVRPLNEEITLSDLQPVLAKELGVSYEKKILQLIGSTKNRNRKEDSNSWFCSELVAHIYKLFHRINDPLILANNVTPNQFQSWFEGDLIKGKASSEIYLREYNREIAAYEEQFADLRHKMKSFKNGKWPSFQIVQPTSSGSLSEVEAPSMDAESVASSGTPEPSEKADSDNSSSSHS